MGDFEKPQTFQSVSAARAQVWPDGHWALPPDLGPPVCEQMMVPQPQLVGLFPAGTPQRLTLEPRPRGGGGSGSDTPGEGPSDLLESGVHVCR